MLIAQTRTHPGPRTNNEDAVLWDPALSLMVVADGMGGHNAGEVASRVAIDSAVEFLRDCHGHAQQPLDIDPRLSQTANRLLNAVKLANRDVFTASQTHTEYSGMGTTLVMAVADSQRLTFISIGDSRLYSLDAGQLRQVTRDDSWVAMISAETGVDISSLKKHPMNHVLTNVVGVRPDVETAVQNLDLVDGQTLMMCTDGLHGALSDDDIQAVLAEETDPGRAADRLIAEALARNVRDNVTVLVARYTAD
jgi:serine/threonine protein phosphatase PrpC